MTSVFFSGCQKGNRTGDSDGETEDESGFYSGEWNSLTYTSYPNVPSPNPYY